MAEDKVQTGEQVKSQPADSSQTGLTIGGPVITPGKLMVGFIGLVASIVTIAVGIKEFWPNDSSPERSVKLGEVALIERSKIGDHFFLNVSFDATITGYKDVLLPVEWAAFDALKQTRATLDPAPDFPTTERGYWDLGVMEAEADVDQGTIPFTFQAPNLGQCIFIRIYVHDTDGTQLDYADSEPFDTEDPENPRCRAASSSAIPRSVAADI